MIIKKYQNYKKSGIEWLGEVPEEWKKVKFKYLAKIRNGKDQKEVQIDDGGYPVLGTGGEFGRASLYLYNKPSVLLGRKGTIDKPQYIEVPFWTVDTLFYTEIFDDVDPKYFFYLCCQIPFHLLQESSAVPSMTQENLNNVFFCKPPLKEQTQIARYLDYQTSIIDQLIKKKEKLIELLKEKRQAIINEAVTKGLNPKAKMKDSGIEWLGEVPEEWSYSKLKWISDIYAGGTPNTNVNHYWENGTIPWLNSGTVNQKRINQVSEYITEEAVKNSSTKWVPKGALLMALAGQGKTKGTVAILEIDATCNQSMAAIVPDSIINNEYLFYWLYVNYERIRGLAGSEQRDGLNLQIIGDIFCPLPKLNEQLEIVKYLNGVDLKIDSSIHFILIQIEKLKEYRQSIISEAVTGKIDVRDWQPNNK